MHWKGNTNYLFKYLSYLRKLNDHNGRPIYWLCMGLGLGRHVVFSWADTLRTCVVLICDFHAFGPNIPGGGLRANSMNSFFGKHGTFPI
jgi:hypothetical protein